MTFSYHPFLIVIPQTENDNNKKHYTKATVLNETDIDEELKKLMDEELLYGDVDYY